MYSEFREVAISSDEKKAQHNGQHTRQSSCIVCVTFRRDSYHGHKSVAQPPKTFKYFIIYDRHGFYQHPSILSLHMSNVNSVSKKTQNILTKNSVTVPKDRHFS